MVFLCAVTSAHHHRSAKSQSLLQFFPWKPQSLISARSQGPTSPVFLQFNSLKQRLTHKNGCSPTFFHSTFLKPDFLIPINPHWLTSQSLPSGILPSSSTAPKLVSAFLESGSPPRDKYLHVSGKCFQMEWQPISHTPSWGALKESGSRPSSKGLTLKAVSGNF